MRTQVGKLGIEVGPVYGRGPYWWDWQLVTLALCALVALCAGLLLPKDHTALRLGPGCYYSVTNMGPVNIQRERCNPVHNAAVVTPSPTLADPATCHREADNVPLGQLAETIKRMQVECGMPAPAAPRVTETPEESRRACEDLKAGGYISDVDECMSNAGGWHQR